MNRSLFRQIVLTATLSLAVGVVSTVAIQTAASASKAPGTDTAQHTKAVRHAMAKIVTRGNRHDPPLKELLAGEGDEQRDSPALSALFRSYRTWDATRQA